MFICNRPGHIRPGSSGTPVAGYDVRVVDDDGSDVPAGTPGHLLVRGDSAGTGYWCQSEATRRTFVGGWVRTGDTYVRNDDGTFSYLGRSDEMLRVGGEWVSPTEVEAALIEHDDVLEAAVVGRLGDDGVTRPVAFIVAAPGSTPVAADIAEYCRTRLAGYKRPRQISVVDQLPKTATGKIQRYKLRGA
jgi:benzoate-CoA ligase